MDNQSLENLELFKYIKGENLDKLLECLNSRIEDVKSGQTIDFSNIYDGWTSYVLSGCVTGDKYEFKEGTLFGKGFFEKYNIKEYKAKTDCKLLVMQYAVMESSCWFSCFFHAAFIDNMNNIREREEEDIKSAHI